jgi:outer membrane protein insertion porin family
MSNRKLYIFLFALFIIYGCSNTKYLPEGDMLYVGGEVTVEDSIMPRRDRKELEKELEGLLRPKPNTTVLGLRPKLWFYNIAGTPKKDKGFRFWLKNKVGEPPVLLSQVDLDYNSDLLRNRAENKGYFRARTSSDSTSRNRRATAEYTVRPGFQWKIKTVKFPSDSSGIKLDSTIARMQRRSLLKPGEPYNLDVIISERERIDARLKQRGYFYFNPDYLLIQVDSTVGEHEVDLIIKVKDDAPQIAREVYRINNIYILPNYNLTNAQDTTDYSLQRGERYKDFTIIDTAQTFRPIIFDRTMFFHKGDIYNRRDHNLSLNRLVNLGTFKFVKNEFRRSDSIPNALDAYYFLTPLPKKSIRVETTAKTNSANYNGTEVSVNWSNRNAFRGAELLTLSAFGGAEVQVSGRNQGFNVYRIGGEASLVWPRFITPFKVKDSSAFIPKTRGMVRYEYQNRQKLYSLNSFRFSFGYIWKENIRKEHQLNVLDVNYVHPANVTDLYREQILEMPSLARVIEQQLIFGPTYSFTYTNTMRRFKKNTIYYKGSLETSGNLTGLIMGASQDDPKHVLGVQFSQFVKMEHDFRHYLKLGRRSTLASRIIAGVGVPYGNSRELPFMRQFFIGGVNSIRAFRARSIGPGTYNPEVEASDFLPDQSGDLKLELNTEYRPKFSNLLEGAVFIDAGNIWLMNGDEANRPGGKISKDFYKELAVGTGIGLRIDVTFLILRLDLAFPIRKPWLPEGDRWVLDEIDFGSKAWRRDNLVFNLAIGYPF